MRTLMLAAAIFMGAVLPAVTANAQAPPQDSVTFTGSLTRSLSLGVEIDVRSGPSGEDPTGRVRVFDRDSGTDVIDGPPSCLVVHPPPVVGAGSFAVVNVPIPPVGAGSVVTFEVREALGSPGFGDVTMAFSDRQRTDCSVPTTTVARGGGQLVIVDAAPLPTSKDQCKNGGWRSFGVFKNQGDCVSFVATGGRNEPAGG
jgi:hypothetical protein